MLEGEKHGQMEDNRNERDDFPRKDRHKSEPSIVADILMISESLNQRLS